MCMRILDIFCGVGGLSYGFSKNSFYKISHAIEIDSDIAKAYQYNHPKVKCLNLDIRNLSNETLKEFGRIDLVIGGPPCQSYSTSGKREMDERAFLFRHYIRVLTVLQPKMFLFENVEGLLSMQKGQLIKQIIQEFEIIGYQIKYQVLDAADYGVPQHRKRVFIVGVKGENTFEFPKPTHNSKNYITFNDATKDLPSIKAGECANQYLNVPLNDYLKFIRNKSNDLTLYDAPKTSEIVQKRMDYLKQGQSNKDLPDELKAKAFPNSYGKLWEDKPVGTITRNFACPSSARCIHPTQNRALTIREGARLQSFPDTYKFYGSDEKKKLEIGNAVPPLLSKALAKQIKNYLNEVRK